LVATTTDQVKKCEQPFTEMAETLLMHDYMREEIILPGTCILLVQGNLWKRVLVYILL
jgi:hypothetical protein